MTRDEVAAELVAGCREGREKENIDKLYAENAVSAEAFKMGDGDRITEGRAGIHGKHDWWNSSMETHSSKVEGPWLHGEDRFAVTFEIDATNKESGERFQMKEIAVYHVADGKIVREEFFYAPPA